MPPSRAFVIQRICAAAQIAAGAGIGQLRQAALLGIAGGELLIPTLIFSYVDLALRRGHKTRGQFVAYGEPADDHRRIRSLQPRPEFFGARA